MLQISFTSLLDSLNLVPNATSSSLFCTLPEMSRVGIHIVALPTRALLKIKHVVS